MMEKLLLGPYGTSIVMLALLGGIVLLLRVLFGPRGLFRDPHWDKRNGEIRAEEAAARERRRKEWLDRSAPPQENPERARTPAAEAGNKEKKGEH